MACSIRSHALMPPATWTKTTGEIGRNVPVLRNNMVKGCCASDTRWRCSWISGPSSSAISVGDSSVTWVGIDLAAGSPNGAGTAMDTLIIFTRLSLARQEADAVIDPGQGGAGHISGPLGPFSQYAVELARVSQQSKGAVAKWRGGVDDDLGDVLLEVAIASALVVGLQCLDRAPGQCAEDAQEVGDPGLLRLIETDLASGVG